MEPIPETAEALDEFLGYDDTELGDTLLEMGRLAQQIAPDCVGLSLGLVRDDLTFTLVASGVDIAAIDAAQYLDDGPCLQTSRTSEVTTADVNDLLDEDRWSLFAQASAASGIASSLSLPLFDRGRVVGGINLYGSSPGTFDGRHQALADALGASAAGAVSNADLTFASRLRAAETPEQLRRRNDIDTAVGLLAARYGESVERAARRLSTAAVRAGIPQAVAARVALLLQFPESP
jgi:GAF domain-containing protein